MIPSRTTFHKAVGEATHIMQRQMVPVLATRQLSLAEGSVGAALAGKVVGLHLQVFAGHVRWAERLPGLGGAGVQGVNV